MPPSVPATTAARTLHMRETLFSNASAPHVEQAWGFLAGEPRRYGDLWRQPGVDRQALLDLLGVRFLVVPHRGEGPSPELGAGGVLVADHPSLAVAVLERPGWKPRARLFERVVVCPSDEAALGALALLGRGPDVLAVTAPHLPAAPIDPAAESIARPARVVARTPSTLTVEVESPRGGGLLVAEAWHPGWRATVDGVEAEVLPAFGALRAVLVPPGARRVVLEYRPASFRLGLAISAATLALVTAALLRARRA